MALILIMGIPGSGKSTFCREMKSFSGNGKVDNVAIFSFDAFLAQCEDLPDTKARETRKEFENWMRNEMSAAPAGRIFLIEDTFHLKSMRRPFLKIARRLNLSIGVVFINVAPEIAVFRNSRREGKERQADEVIWKMWEGLEPPEEVGNVVEINGEGHAIKSLDELMKALKIERSTEVPKKIKNEPIHKRVRKVSSCQKFDVMTRRVVGDILKSSNFGIDARKLNEARKVVLQRIKMMKMRSGEDSDSDEEGKEKEDEEDMESIRMKILEEYKRNN